MATNAVVGSEIALGTYSPYSVAVGRSGQYVYVASQPSATNPQSEIVIIDAATKAVVKRIPLTNTDGSNGFKPGGLAVNPAETRLYVANNDSSSFSVWDIANNSEVSRPTLTTTSSHGAPEAMVLNVAGDTLYVANSGTDSNSVSVFAIDETVEPATYTKVAEIPVGPNPMGLSLDETNKKLYVANFWNGSLSVIDTVTNSKVGEDILLGGGNTPAVTASATKLYVSNIINKITQVLKSDPTLPASQSLFASAPWPWGISYDSVTNKVIAALYQTGAGQVGIYNADTGSSLATITLNLGAEPKSVGNFVGPALPYFINVTAGANGTVSPVGLIPVNSYGRTFTVTPNPTYMVQDVTVDGNSIGTPVEFTVANVTANKTVNVTFTAGTSYILTMERPLNGTVSSPMALAPNGGKLSLQNGTIQTITVQPSAGYKVSSWTNCDTPNGNSCTVTMNANRTVSVAFEVAPPGGPVKVVDINGNDGASFANIYSACTDTGTQPNYIIKMTTAQSSVENLLFDYGKTMLTLKGGYDDETFQNQGGYTRIGTLTIGNTGVIVDRITIY